MADEFHLGSGNWWESSSSSSRNLKRYESRVGSATTSTSSLHNSNNNNSMGSFGTWPTEIVDIKARPSMDSVSVSGSSISMLHFPNNDSGQKLPPPHESSPSAGLLPDPSLQIMGLGLSSQTKDWNQALFRGGEKGGEGSGGFRSTLQEEASNTNFHQQEQQWRHKIYPSAGSGEDSSRLSLDHSNMSSGSSNVNIPNFPPPHHQQHNQMDSLGFLVLDNQQQQMNYSYPMMITSSYGMSTSHDHQLLPSWANSSNKFPQFLRTSPPKQQLPQPPPQGQLQFSNNTPIWNASSTSTTDIVAAAAAAATRPSGLFPSSLQSQLPLPNFDEKPKNTSEARDLAIAKKNSNETSSKRQRNETPAPMPTFKVRKEKMGDRITALQQLVSPFGKTDTASVLSEAIEYIKFLLEQVSLLSTPYMKSGAPVPHAHHQRQQNPDKSKDPEAVPKENLRSRGLCLVPISSTFPVTHETTVDFWTPTYGGTFR